MNIDKTINCPKCGEGNFIIKREATYLYSYKLENSSDRSDEEALPFLFDNREKIHGKEYLQCENCQTQYPCNLDELNGKIHFTILQKAIRSDLNNPPQFLG